MLVIKSTTVSTDHIVSRDVWRETHVFVCNLLVSRKHYTNGSNVVVAIYAIVYDIELSLNYCLFINIINCLRGDSFIGSGRSAECCRYDGKRQKSKRRVT